MKKDDDKIDITILPSVAAATPTPTPPPTFKEIVERVLEELANLPKEQLLPKDMIDKFYRVKGV